MLKNKLKIVTAFIIGFITCGVIAYASVQFQADEVGYKGTTVDKALDDLYLRADSSNSIKLCKRLSEGTSISVGDKYECTLGDQDENNNYIKRNFYILAIYNNSVDMIMERNITEGTENKKISWNDAMNYFNSGNPGYKYTTAWTNVVNIGLPSSISVARAVDNNSWNLNDTWFCFGLKDTSSCIANNYANATPQAIEAVQKYKWLFNYLPSCIAFGCDSETELDSNEAGGYWCKDNWKNSSNAMTVDHTGRLNDTSTTNPNFGIRPAITVLKSSLY